MSEINSANPVAVIIPTFNRLEFTKICLNAFLKYTNFRLVHSVTVYDNHSEDGTFEYLKTLDLNVIQGNFPNANCSINSFVSSHKNSNVKYLLKLDNDRVVKKDWLDVCHNFMITRPTVGTLFFCKRTGSYFPSPSNEHGGNWITPFFLLKKFGAFPDKGKYPGCHTYHRFVSDNNYQRFAIPDLAIDLSHLPVYDDLVKFYNQKGYMRLIG